MRFVNRRTVLLLLAVFAVPVLSMAHDPIYPIKHEMNYGLVFWGLGQESTNLQQTLELENYPITSATLSEVKAMQKPLPPMSPSAEERDRQVARFQTALNHLMTLDETTELHYETGGLLGLSHKPRLVVERKPVKFHLLADAARRVPVIVVNATTEPLNLAWQGSDKGQVTVYAGGTSRFFVTLKATDGQKKAAIRFGYGDKGLNVKAPVELTASGRVKLQVVDENGAPTASRVYVKGADGESYFPEGATPRLMDDGERYCYIPSAASVTLPAGESQIEFVRGFEYRPKTVPVVVRAGEEASVTVKLERWVDMPAKGWFSGDGHIHMSLGGTIKMKPEDAIQMLEAEDVHLGNMVVSNCWGDDVFDREHFEGKNNRLSSPRHIMRWGEEYRNDHIGHMILYNLKRLTSTVYAGFANTPWPNDVPLNADIADEALAQGAFVTGAHPMPNRGEHAIDVALGKMEGMEIIGYGAFWQGGLELLHPLWDCGFRTVATAGTDSFLNVVRRDPLGGARCYARIDGAFSNESWMKAVAAGHTFVSTAPMLFFDVDGAGPGDEVKRAKGEKKSFRVKARAVSQWPLDNLTILYNGKPLAVAKANKNEIVLEGEYELPDSGWIAAMCSGPHNRYIMGGNMFVGQTQVAHTTPVWVNVAGKPQPPSESAKFLLKMTDNFIAMMEKTGKYADATQRAHMREVYGRARALFAEKAKQYDDYVACQRAGQARQRAGQAGQKQAAK